MRSQLLTPLAAQVSKKPIANSEKEIKLVSIPVQDADALYKQEAKHVSAKVCNLETRNL
jgi:hypothetical protein